MAAPSDPVPGTFALDAAATPSDEDPVVCPHADRCGGCPLITLGYAEQLALKRGRVVQAISRYPSLDRIETDPVSPASPRLAYRTRAKLVVAPGGLVGLFAKGGGHRVVDIPGCRVLDPMMTRVANALRARIADAEARGGPLAPFDPAGPGLVRALDLRLARDEDGARVLVTFVVDASRGVDATRFVSAAEDLMRALPEVAGVAVNFHGGSSPQMLGGETVRVAGAAWLPDRVGRSVHRAAFGSFVQAHRGQAERLHRWIAEAVLQEHERPRVLDLYAGSGAIALGLAAAGAQVHAVESFAPAAARAEEEAAAQSLDVRARCADVTVALRDLERAHATFDAAVVNPPRRGMSPAAREGLARLAPKTIAYVSCDAETLARDLDHLARLGYVAGSLRPVDMIPLTDEVETLAILHRAGTPVPVVFYQDDDVLIVDKSPHEPTAPQTEYALSLLSRARRIRPSEQPLVPVYRLDVGTSGAVAFVRGAEHLARWERVFASPSSRMIYLTAVRGVTPSKGVVTRDLRDGAARHSARTRYRRLAVVSGQSLLRVVPDQPRAHQIRRHLASIGHPVLGDDRYGHGPTNRHFEEKNALDRTFLHAVRLEFEHPATGQRHVVEAPLPGDLRTVLERISGPGTLKGLDHKNALGAMGSSTIPPPAPDDETARAELPLDIDVRSRTIRPEPAPEGHESNDED